MEIDKASALVTELAELLGGLVEERYVEAINVLIADHAELAERLYEVRNGRTGKRERVVMEYMQTIPSVPMTPKSVELALDLDYSVADAMDNLSQKGRLQRLGKHAVYRYMEEK